MQFRRKWASAFAALALVLAIAAGCGAPADRAKVDNLVVNVVDVGQGDAILIRTPGQVTLVDSGDVPARDKLVAYIKKQGITAIDTLIITHPHADHLGGATAILDNFTVRRIYDSGQTTTSALYRQYLAAATKKNIPFALLTADKEVDIGGGTLKILNPPAPPPSAAKPASTTTPSSPAWYTATSPCCWPATPSRTPRRPWSKNTAPT